MKLFTANTPAALRTLSPRQGALVDPDHLSLHDCTEEDPRAEADGSASSSLALGFAGRRLNPGNGVGIWRHQRSDATGVDTRAALWAQLALYAHRGSGEVTKCCHIGHFRDAFAKPLFPLFEPDDQRLTSLT